MAPVFIVMIAAGIFASGGVVGHDVGINSVPTEVTYNNEYVTNKTYVVERVPSKKKVSVPLPPRKPN